MKRVIKLRFVLSNLLFPLFIIVNVCFISSGCSSNSFIHYSNENNGILYENPITEDGSNNTNDGPELTVTHKFGLKISGEILYVRDSSLVICEEYSASEKELANGVYTIKSIELKDITKITIEGIKIEFWEGAMYGAAIGAGTGVVTGLVLGDDTGKEAWFTAESKAIGLAIVFSLIGSIVGGITASIIATDDVVIRTTHDYDFTELKSFARYPDEEPEFLINIE